MTLTPQIDKLKNELEVYLSQFNWDSLSKGQKKVLDAFSDVAITHGFTAVTMRSLATALNMKAPSLYAHFPEGREQIVAQTLRWHYSHYGFNLLKTLDESENLQQCWENLIEIHLAHQIKKPESKLWDLMIITYNLGGWITPELGEEMSYWSEFTERVYFEIAKALELNPSIEKVKMMMVVLEHATQWTTWDGTDVSFENIKVCTLKHIKMIFEN